MSGQHFVLTLSCHDQPGIVAAVSDHIFNCGGNITDSGQHNDAELDRFFMRTAFVVREGADLAQMRSGFDALAARYGMALTAAPRATSAKRS